MRTVSVLKKDRHRVIRLPRDLDFHGVNELEIIREGETLVLRPVKPGGRGIIPSEQTEQDCMKEIEAIISDAGYLP